MNLENKNESNPEKLDEINKLYDNTMNMSYLGLFLTSKTQKIANYKLLIEKYENYINNFNITNTNIDNDDNNTNINNDDNSTNINNDDNNINNDDNSTNINNDDNSTNINNDDLKIIYLKLINLYSLINDDKNVLNYHCKYLNSLSNDELNEKLKQYSQEYLQKLLNWANETLKIKLYKYLVVIDKKYLDSFISEFYEKEKEFLEPYIKESFESLLGTREAQKYGKLLNLDYAITTDPLPSNVDYYLSLKNK